MAKILIAEDHTLFRKAMMMLIQSFGMQIKGAANGSEGLHLLSEEKFDLVITDLRMPVMDGVEFTENIKANYPDVKIIILTMHDSVRYMKHMVQMGVQSFLLKNIEPEELKTAIKEVLNGRSYFPHDVANALLQEMLVKPAKLREDITNKELSVLKLIADEKTVSEIAAELGISPRTVESYKVKMIEKLNVKSTVGLVRKAVEEGLIGSII